ncbi:MAG: methylated-DNA--[protein]-cysteine S-methyltransferase [Bradyrhizobium sp.]|mgnify:FL=1
MSGQGFTIFDTAVGRCGIAWGHLGIIGVQLPEARELETRRRMYRIFPDAREQRPPLNTEIAIEGIVALLRGDNPDMSDVALDLSGMSYFNQRVYQFVRGIPRGETRTYEDIANGLRVQGAVHLVAQVIGRNPFLIIVPCHRVLEAGNYADRMAPNGGVISKRRLLTIEGAHPTVSKTLFEVLLPPAAPPRPHGS